MAMAQGARLLGEIEVGTLDEVCTPNCPSPSCSFRGFSSGRGGVGGGQFGVCVVVIDNAQG